MAMNSSRSAVAVAVLLIVAAASADARRILQSNAVVGLKGQNIGGFVLASDVHGYPDVHLDVCDIKSLVQSAPPNFEGAFKIYADGKNAFRSNGAPRTLKQWATADLSADPFVQPFIAENNDLYFLNSWVTALNGTTFLSQDAARAAALYATLRSSVSSMYMFHEIDVAGNKTAYNLVDDATGAPHNLDEAFAIWAGDAKGECSPLGLAKEAAQAANTGTDVAAETLNAFLAMQVASRSGDSAKYNASRADFIKRGVLLPSIQMVLKNAQQMTTDAGSAQASAFAYYRTILPMIKAVSASDSEVISNAINISGAPQDGAYATIQNAFASVLSSLGLTKADLGDFAPASPSPPPPQACAYKGAFRLRSISCPKLLLAAPLACSNNAAALRKASSAIGNRSIWKLNQASGAFGSISSPRKCPNTILAATDVPSIAASGKFKASPVTAGSCGIVNLVAEKATSKGAFLTVNKACTGFSWSTSGASSQAKFAITSA